jgi:hypothetical protein
MGLLMWAGTSVSRLGVHVSESAGLHSCEDRGSRRLQKILPVTTIQFFRSIECCTPLAHPPVNQWLSWIREPLLSGIDVAKWRVFTSDLNKGHRTR